MMIRLNDALSTLTAIHAQLAKGEVYQGLRARPVLLSGLLGLAASVVQVRYWPDLDAVSFIWYWLIVGAICGLAASSSAIASYFWDDVASSRRHTRVVAGQFIPCLAVGAFLALALLPVMDRCVGLLPGLWSLIYCLGLFSVRPYLPHATGWVGVYYFAGGVALLGLMSPANVPSPWTIGLVFAIGQAGLAWVLHRNAVREKDLG